MADGSTGLRAVGVPHVLADPDVRRPGIAGSRRAGLSVWVLVIAAAQVAVLLATSTRYGYHRDELYFIVAGSHPAFGYPDQPPLVPLLSWAMHALAPSLVLLRAPSALVAGTTTILAALIARELGGRTRAQVIAAGCTASSGFALAVTHDHQYGCRSWSGTYTLVQSGGQWQIQRANITPETCN